MNTPSASVLDAFLGMHPLVLLFAPSDRAPAFEEQVAQIQGGAAAGEGRQFVIAQCLWEGASRIGDEKLSDEETAHLRERLGIDEERFCIVVLGADGQEKLRGDSPLKFEAILDALGPVDRQRESRL